MKRTFAFLAAALVAAFASFGQDFAALDALHDQKKLAEEIAALKQYWNASDPQAAVAFRLVRAMQQEAVDLGSSKGQEKVRKLDEAINFGKPLLPTAKGSSRERARLHYWYAVSIAQKGKAKGVLNSLFMAPEIRSICDQAIGIDPTFGDPYYLKALLDDAIPGIAGGDKSRMGQLFAKAVQLDPSNVWYLVDFARALKSRGWDEKANRDGAVGVPAGMSDLAYARELAKKADAAFAALAAPSIEQKAKLDELRTAGL